MIFSKIIRIIRNSNLIIKIRSKIKEKIKKQISYNVIRIIRNRKNLNIYRKKETVKFR